MGHGEPSDAEMRAEIRQFKRDATPSLPSGAMHRQRMRDERREREERERIAALAKEAEEHAHEAMMAQCTEQFRSMAEHVGEEAATAISDFVLALIRGEHR